jgi:hypothetical protein
LNDILKELKWWKNYLQYLKIYKYLTIDRVH